MRVAIYARVSTERQERQQTIDSQLDALRGWVVTSKHLLDEDHVFRDEGYSGARLDRPGLDALRDIIRDGAVELAAVLSPDRLARRYAYQVLLLEEFRRAGCEVVFLHHPISQDPNDQLLLQIQGAIAEYERAVLGERFRRGKLQKARDGRYITGRAPYGYRYVPRRDDVPGQLLVDEREAELVRTLYGWLTDERMTIRQIVKRLNAGPYLPRSGRHAWPPSTVHHILSDPIYTGTAYANRYTYVPATKPRRTVAQRSPRTGEATCRRLKPREQWIAIPVPALVDAETWDRAQAQMARNAALSFRNNAKHDYLLRCLLTCEACGLAMYGITRAATARLPQRQYYECHGKDCILSARTSVCPSRAIKAETIERAVWEHVASLLAEPAQLQAQFECFTAAEAGSPRDLAAEQRLHSRLERIARADRRLLDAYQAEAISLAELTERRRQLAKERQDVERQQEERAQLRQQRMQAETVRTDLAEFCAHMRSCLKQASFADKQATLQLLIERIIVGDGRLEIRHVIPLRPPPPSGSGPATLPERLRSDGVDRAPLRRHRRPERGQRLLEAGRAVDDQELRRPQPARHEIVQHPAPGGFALTAHAARRQQHLLPVAPDAEHHQQREGGGLAVEPHLHHRAVQHQPDDVLGPEIAPAPGIPVRLRLAPRPADHVLADRAPEQRRQGTLHPSRVGAREIGRGDQRLHLPGPTRVVRQHCAAPLPLRPLRPAQPRPRHRDLHRPEGAGQTPPSVPVPVSRRAAPFVATAAQRRRQLLLHQFLDQSADPAPDPGLDRIEPGRPGKQGRPCRAFNAILVHGVVSARRANAGIRVLNSPETTPLRFPTTSATAPLGRCCRSTFSRPQASAAIGRPQRKVLT
jgi:site-specific DNA recombinase